MAGGTVHRHMYTMKKALQEGYDEDRNCETLSLAVGYPVQAHHLISCSVMQQLEGGKMARLAEKSGYDINNGNNGIALPAYFGHQRKDSKVRHRGGHSDEYYENVRTELAKIFKDYKDTNPCKLKEDDRKNINGDLADLEDLIRGNLEKRQWWLYDWSKQLWDGDYRDEGAGEMDSPREREGSYSAGLQWLADHAGPKIKRRYRMVNGESVVRSDWYKHYGYPAPDGLTS